MNFDEDDNDNGYSNMDDVDDVTRKLVGQLMQNVVFDDDEIAQEEQQKDQGNLEDVNLPLLEDENTPATSMTTSMVALADLEALGFALERLNPYIQLHLMNQLYSAFNRETNELDMSLILPDEMKSLRENIAEYYSFITDINAMYNRLSFSGKRLVNNLAKEASKMGRVDFLKMNVEELNKLFPIIENRLNEEREYEPRQMKKRLIQETETGQTGQKGQKGEERPQKAVKGANEITQNATKKKTWKPKKAPAVSKEEKQRLKQIADEKKQEFKELPTKEQIRRLREFQDALDRQIELHQQELRRQSRYVTDEYRGAVPSDVRNQYDFSIQGISSLIQLPDNDDDSDHSISSGTIDEDEELEEIPIGNVDQSIGNNNMDIMDDDLDLEDMDVDDNVVLENIETMVLNETQKNEREKVAKAIKLEKLEELKISKKLKEFGTFASEMDQLLKAELDFPTADYEARWRRLFFSL